MSLNYDPQGPGFDNVDGAGSDQMQSFYWLRNSIIESRKDQFFMPLANVTSMPKHYGKTIKVHEYVPLLDDRNNNNQGLDAAGALSANGNLYGSSKDIGTVVEKLPLLNENGGRKNRVGFTRLSLEGSITKFGFFTEFTQESLDFDSDDKLREHLSRELMNGAVQLTEAVLQQDLLVGAGTIIRAGGAVSDATITGEAIGGLPASVVTYKTMMRLDQTLTDNRTPRQTTIISGSRFTDTKVVPACRIMYVGSEIVPYLKGMKDLFGNKAFIEIQHYADAGNALNGEIGSMDQFRIIQVPEMLYWAAAGDTVGTNPGFRTEVDASSDERYNVYPMLVVGEDSFTSLGFLTNGKTVNFTTYTKMPGKESVSHDDPFGETGLSSIKWYYGVLIKRPERLGLIKTVAPL